MQANQPVISVATKKKELVGAYKNAGQEWLPSGEPVKVKERYPDAKQLVITADGGGSNGHRVRLWKLELSRLAQEIGLDIDFHHFPPGTSKWNKIEHRLFSFITMNWRGRLLIRHEVIVNLIASTKTRSGLTVRAELGTVKIERNEFHGEWNYRIRSS